MLSVSELGSLSCCLCLLVEVKQIRTTEAVSLAASLGWFRALSTAVKYDWGSQSCRNGWSCEGLCCLPPPWKVKFKKQKGSLLFSVKRPGWRVRRQRLHFTWKNHTWELELHGNSISAHVVNKGSALVSAALISFGCIMSNININTCAIDFSSPGCSGKRSRLRAKKRRIRFHWIRFGGFMSAVISWNSNFSLWPSLISLPEPIIRLFPSFISLEERKRCISVKERQKLWSPSLPGSSYPPRTTQCLCCGTSTERGGQICGCSMEIKWRVFCLGPHKGHPWGRGWLW